VINEIDLNLKISKNR